MTDEFLCDIPAVRIFIGSVKDCIVKGRSIEERLVLIRPVFSRLLSDPDWLPVEFRRPLESGGMGKGIANWLLFRDSEGKLSFTALVLPPGVATPVHDHLAWGLVGLYAGRQEEEMYEAGPGTASNGGYMQVRLVGRNSLAPGSLYELIPPHGDIHRVVTSGDQPSISLHLLANDIGCILRHIYQPETGEVQPFRSQYSNYQCAVEGTPG